MRIPGYCTGCRRIKQVRVSGHQMAVGAARGGNVYEGICSDCEAAKTKNPNPTKGTQR